MLTFIISYLIDDMRPVNKLQLQGVGQEKGSSLKKEGMKLKSSAIHRGKKQHKKMIMYQKLFRMISEFKK